MCPSITQSLTPYALVSSILLLAGTALAQPSLYIAEYKFNDARMRSIALDGSNPQTLFNLPAAQWLPIGLTVNPATNRLYWIDAAGSSKVISSNLNGTGSVVTPVTGSGRGASLDAQGRFYYSASGVLYRVNADGTNRVTLFTGAVPNTMGNPRVDATNNHVYVGSDGRIYRMNLDGTDVKVILRGASIVRAIGLDVANNYIYWADADTLTDFIGRARLDGSEYTILIDNSPLAVGSSGISDLLVDPPTGSIFIANDLNDTVRKHAIDGTNPQVVYTSVNGQSPSGLVLSTGEFTQPLLDCDNNGISDTTDILNGAADCDNNGYLDSCQTNPCPTRTFLLDNGSNAADTQGRAVGVPSQWQVFQPFDVPADGWTISEIGLDGYMSNFADSSGLTARIYPDNGSGAFPNETVQLGSARISLLFNTYEVNWRYAPIIADAQPSEPLTLSAGRYWVRIEANSPTLVGASLNHGFTGLTSKSRGSSGNFTNSTRTVAVRLVEAPASTFCIADFNQDGGVDGSDIEAFFTAWSNSEPLADANQDGGVDGSDVEVFFLAWENGGC